MNRYWKWLLSFMKSSWQLDDYPIRYFPHSLSKPESGHQQTILAEIIGWHLIGHGQTKSEALAALSLRFREYQLSGKSLPRPGSDVPITMAPTDRVGAYEQVAREFIPRVLGHNFDQCFISDESSLWDFHTDTSNTDLHKKIALLYGVDVTDIENGNLVAIFERIAARRRPV